MEASRDNYSLLIKKLDQFTRKFYVNKLIRGILYSVAILVVLFLAVNLLEHFFNFSTGGRKLLFFSFIGISILSIAGLIVHPLLQYFNLGRVISHEKAAQMIGSHFSNVKDKLLNILQLKEQSKLDESDLIAASIDQKIEELKPVPFKSAINLQNNRKYLRYAVPPLLLLLVLLFSSNIIENSTNRIINNDTEYVKEAPFKFVIDDEDLSVVQYEDFDLKVDVVGEARPKDVFINVDNYQYKLKESEPGTWTYKFKKVQKNTNFQITASGFNSDEYELAVLKKPNILGFDIQLDYPAYTGRKDEALSNIGDLVVPAGTKIGWVFNAQNTDDISIKFGSSKKLSKTERSGEQRFVTGRRLTKDDNYTVYVSNSILPNSDSVSYAISVIPDLYPSIKVEEFKDSTDAKVAYFVGDASDDYGIKSLNFNYRIEKEKKVKNVPTSTMKSVPLPIKSKKQTAYDYTLDIETLELEPGDKITYYFEVFDNDGVTGSKSARTNIMTYAMPTVKEFKEMAEKNNTEIKDDLEKAIEESKEARKDIKKLQEKLLQKKELDWQDKKEIEKMLERQKDLQKQLENAQQNFEENMKNQEEFEQPKEELLKKQEQVQKLFEELMSEEMKELMRKMEELLEEMDKKDILEELEDMDMNDEELEKELDRMLELFKQLELEKQMNDAIDELEKLAEEQEELAKETEEGKTPQEELEEKQEEINEKFEDIKEQMEDIEKKNEELEQPNEMPDTEEQEKEIDDELQKSSESLDQKQNNKASKSQKKASDKMKEMAEQMQSMMAAAQAEQMEEDIDALRQLLENLVNMSFDQEELMDDIRETNINTPKYVELIQEQYKLKDDFQLIEDSLQALSKRVFQIESFVTEKVTDIKSNLKSGIDQLEERKKPSAQVKQQLVMTDVNELALMLSEVMSQMQQQMAQSMPGSQQCQKPGGKGKGGKPKLGQMQKQLNDQMSKMSEQMKDGKKPGGKKGGKGQSGSSKQFAEMAAKQSALRKALKELQQEKQQRGQGDPALQEMIDQMDKTETDLVNKRLTNDMLKRQEEILTRLLEHERAEREKEYEEKRESKTAKEKERKMPPNLAEYIKKREAEIDMYKSVNPNLKPYYKFLVEEYFKALKN